MKISTTRFGDIDINEEHYIEFRDGMVGFSALKRYTLVESSNTPLILWLQSVDSPAIAFPVIEPWFFRRDYKAPMTDADKHSINFDANDKLKIFAVLTIPEDFSKLTVNLKAPIVINLEKASAAQVILQDKTLSVREPAFEAFTGALSAMSISQSASDFDDEVETFSSVNLRDRPTPSVEVEASI